MVPRNSTFTNSDGNSEAGTVGGPCTDVPWYRSYHNSYLVRDTSASSQTKWTGTTHEVNMCMLTRSIKTQLNAQTRIERH